MEDAAPFPLHAEQGEMNIEFAERRDTEDSVRVAGKGVLRHHSAFRVADFVPVEGANAIHIRHLRQGGAPRRESRRDKNDPCAQAHRSVQS